MMKLKRIMKDIFFEISNGCNSIVNKNGFIGFFIIGWAATMCLLFAPVVILGMLIYFVFESWS